MCYEGPQAKSYVPSLPLEFEAPSTRPWHRSGHIRTRRHSRKINGKITLLREGRNKLFGSQETGFTEQEIWSHDRVQAARKRFQIQGSREIRIDLASLNRCIH